MPLVSDRNRGYFRWLATIRFVVRCFSGETSRKVWNHADYCRIFAVSKGTNDVLDDKKRTIK